MVEKKRIIHQLVLQLKIMAAGGWTECPGWLHCGSIAVPN